MAKKSAKKSVTMESLLSKLESDLREAATKMAHEIVKNTRKAVLERIREIDDWDEWGIA